MLSELPFEWFVLLLRVIFIFLLYFFIFQVMRVISRELRVTAEAAGPERVRGTLLVEASNNEHIRPGDAYVLEPVTIIGRSRDATVRIDSAYVSAEHAQISWNDGRWWATDLRSTNGTRVNSRPITEPERLNIGDRIEIGDVVFQLVP
ncbi:MAG TPA: FHA domain-containing protein [Thermomicrobiales bacterium]|nr:FHA domain-containing protein [Thermomicrobiales bacterium]